MSQHIIATVAVLSLQLTLSAGLVGQPTEAEGAEPISSAVQGWSAEQVAVVRLAGEDPVSREKRVERASDADPAASRAFRTVRGQNALKGIKLGAPLGALAGVLLGTADGLVPFGPAVGAVVGLAGGAAFGAAVGALQPTRPWWDR